MKSKIHSGLTFRSEMTVTERDTAKSFGSGNVKVLATPVMIGLMENAASKSVNMHLPKGYTTVGIGINVRHLAATPVGMKVHATAQLTKVEGKKLRFKIEAYDEKEKIGKGDHERYIVDTAQFAESAYAKL